MLFSTILNLITVVALVATGIFAGVQIRHLQRQRSREYVMQLLHSFQTSEFQIALHQLVDIPEGLSKKEIEEKLGDKLPAMYVMFGTFEALGALVHRREIGIGLVEDFFSGVVILAWKKFSKYIYTMRELGNRSTYYEWFQWLAEQIQKRESETPAIPAHIAFKDWNE